MERNINLYKYSNNYSLSTKERAPSADDRPVWIMIPLDTLQDAPQVIATEQKEGKNTILTSTIIIK